MILDNKLVLTLQVYYLTCVYFPLTSPFPCWYSYPSSENLFFSWMKSSWLRLFLGLTYPPFSTRSNLANSFPNSTFDSSALIWMPLWLSWRAFCSIHMPIGRVADLDISPSKLGSIFSVDLLISSCTIYLTLAAYFASSLMSSSFGIILLLLLICLLYYDV